MPTDASFDQQVDQQLDQHLDQQLARLAPLGCELDNGFTSHLPMVIDALRALGRADAIAGWLDQAEPRGLVRPERLRAVDAAAWRDALGDGARFSDWAELFGSEIDRDGWPAVVETWCARFAPGFASGATHGVIRTGHAVRLLLDVDTAERRRELADALASWAAQYSELPVQPLPRSAMVAGGADKELLEVLADLPRVPEEHRRNDGAITTALAQLVHADGLSLVVSRVDLSTGDAPKTSSRERAQQLAQAFARVFVASVTTPLEAVVFTHAITSAAAVRTLAEVVSASTVASLLDQCWLTGCALTATYASYTSEELRTLELDATADSDEFTASLVERCITSGDDHAIKLTEACMSLFRATNDSALLAAANRGNSLL